MAKEPATKKAAKKKASPKKKAVKKTAKKTTAKRVTGKATAKKKVVKKTTAEKAIKKKTTSRKTATRKTSRRKKTVAPEAPQIRGLEFDETDIGLSSDNLVVETRSRQMDFEAIDHSHHQEFPPPERDLPARYDETRVTLLARDPEWVFTYWEISLHDRAEQGMTDENAVLRLSDVTDIAYDGANAHSSFDTFVGGAERWYLRLPTTERSWIAEIGVRSDDGGFSPVICSNAVSPPRATVSPHGPEEEWMTVETDLENIFVLSGGRHAGAPGTAGGAGPMGSEAVAPGQRVSYEFTRLRMGSEQLASGALLGRNDESAERGFRFAINAELIIYGSTEPDARVTIQGHPVRLGPDGAFRLRLALPDGEQRIEAKAVRSDEEESRETTLVVTRDTK